MFVLRCTKKLQSRLGVACVDAEAGSTAGRLGEWYANLLTHHRRPVVLFVSKRTLLPVVAPLGPSATLVPRFVEALGELLRAIGVEERHVVPELGAMRSCSYAPTANRRVVGSLNDFASLLEAVPPGEPLLHASLAVADAPCRPIGWESPKSATLLLLGAHDGSTIDPGAW